MIVVIFDFNACSVTASTVFCVLALARYCEHCFLRFSVCSVTASTVFCVLAFAALLRALFFAFQCLQRYCEHCFLRFIACSVTASTVFCVSALAALLRALFFAFQCLQRHCEHCFLRFIVCSVTASIKIFVFTFAECRPTLPVFTPAAFKAAGNKLNESNQSDYSATGRTAAPRYLAVRSHGDTAPELKCINPAPSLASGDAIQ